MEKQFLCVILSFFSSLALAFEQQVGQIKDQEMQVNNNVLFVTQANGMSVFLTKNGFSYQIITPKDNEPPHDGSYSSDLKMQSYLFNRVDIEFVNSNATFTIETYDKMNNHLFYYTGSPMKKRYAQSFQKVVYRNIYNHVDIEFIDINGTVKYNIIVYPGGDLSQVELKYKTDAKIDVADEKITIHTPLNSITDQIPESYTLNTHRKKVDVFYKTNRGNIGYKLINSNLQSTDTLVIDPMPHRFFGTYYGGLNDEYANEITIDEAGYTYVTGHTNSLNNIATTGTYQGSFNAVFDAFIAKFSPEGNRVWGTYIGGNSFDRAFGIDYNNGYLFVVGSTFSTNFSTSGVHQENSFGDDAFVAKFDTTGNRIWCSYYGGDLHDFAAAVVTDSDENIYLTGHTLSSFNIASAGAHMETYSGNSAAFLAKFNTNGGLEWGTYYGNTFEEGWGITLDSNEEPIFSGFTSSTTGISTPGAHQENMGGAMDAFLAKFDQAGTRLWGTYYGGANDDFGYEVDCDNQDNIFFVGGTSSTNNIYFNSGFQSVPGSIDDGFVAKFDNDGTVLWGTYIGGNEAEYLYGLQSYLDDGVVITGMTQSAESIATSSAYQGQLGGQYDALVMKLSPNGDLQWGTYYGGSFSEEGRGIAINPLNGYFSLTGYTMSSSNIASVAAFQENFGGGNYDAFVAKFCAPVFPVLDYNFSGDLCTDDDEVLSITSTSIFNSIEWNTGATSSEIDLSQLPVGSYTFYVNTLDSNNCPAYSDTLEFDKYESTPLNIQQNQTDYCAGDDLTLWTVDDFSDYLWSTNVTDTLVSFQNMNTGSFTFSLIATNEDGCISYDTVEINVNPSPNPNLNVQGSANFCLGETVDVGVSGTFSSYSWFNGQNSNFITLEEEDTVWVYVENQFGCGAYSDTVFINSDVLTPIVELLSNPTFCEDSSFLFGVNNAYDDYEWMNGEETSTIELNLGAGVHYVYVNVSNQCGGAAQSDSLALEVFPTTQASIDLIAADTLCAGEEVTFYVQGAFDFVEWQNEFSGTEINFSPNNPGEYTFVVETIDTNGCPSFDTLTVEFEDCNLSIVPHNLPNGWRLYPNPSSDKVYVDSSIPLVLSIYSSEGRKIKTMNVSNGDGIDLNDLPPGVYSFVPVMSNGSFKPIKVVVH